MDRRGWTSVHLYYQGDLEGPLLALVEPLARRGRPSGELRRFFFLRYWDGGPHLRLRWLAARGASRALEEDLRARCEGYLDEHPSPTVLEPGEYAATASRLARAEGLEEYERTPRPNNTFRFVPYRPEVERYGSGASLEAVERHFDESSRIVLGLLRARPDGERRVTSAFSLLLLAWLEGGVVAGVSGRAPRPTADLRARFERQRRALSTLAQRAIEGSRTEDGERAGVLAAWRRSIADLVARLREKPPPAGVATVVDHCAHLMCNRLGLSLSDEDYVRYLAARVLGEAQPPAGAE